jgi:hypothetical protein
VTASRNPAPDNAGPLETHSALTNTALRQEAWFVADVRRWLAANITIRGLVMHSDPEPREDNDGNIVLLGHAGTTYQALSAPCLGRTSPRRITLVNGLVFSDRARSKILNLEQGWRYAAQQLVEAGADPFDVARDDPREWLPAALRQAGAKRRDHGGCWKYAAAVGVNARQRARVRIAGTPCAYPKLDLGQMKLFLPRIGHRRFLCCVRGSPGRP